MPAVGLAMVGSDNEDPTAEKPSDGFGLGSVLLLRAHKLTLTYLFGRKTSVQESAAVLSRPGSRNALQGVEAVGPVSEVEP